MALSSHEKNQISEFLRDFKKLPDDVRKLVRPMLRESASPALAEVKRNASWSSRIPGATKVGLRFNKRFTGVTLYVNRKSAPNARPIENKGKPGSFRHPVFGKSTWVSQTARPFFYGVAEHWQDEVNQNIGAVVDRVTKSHGFK